MPRAIILILLPLLLLSRPLNAAELDPSSYRAITAYARALLVHRVAGTDEPSIPPSIRTVQRACFVTFFHKGKVIACFGGFMPRTAGLGDEIRENVRLALKNDPRAAAISPETAAACRVQITLPEQPRKVDNPLDIDPSRDGLFVEAPDGRGVAIVPGEARTAGYALRSALYRLGLTSTAPGLRLYRFSATIIR